MKNFYKINSQLALPFLGTKQEFLKQIFETLSLKFGLVNYSNQRFIDLGSGDGRIIIYSTLNYGIKSTGIEINSDLIKEAQERVKSLKKEKKIKKGLVRKIKNINGDFFEQDLVKYDFIYIYGLPTVEKFLKHIFLTAKNKAVIISYEYPFKVLKSCLKLVYRLDHKNENQEASTFFYRKI
ncbi:MAG: class I SAM-dependent methyltransferase [Promethearchaeota archaeon]